MQKKNDWKMHIAAQQGGANSPILPQHDWSLLVFNLLITLLPSADVFQCEIEAPEVYYLLITLPGFVLGFFTLPWAHLCFVCAVMISAHSLHLLPLF